MQNSHPVPVLIPRVGLPPWIERLVGRGHQLHLSTIEARVLDTLRKNGALTPAGIGDITAISTTSILQALRSLSDRGLTIKCLDTQSGIEMFRAA